MILKSLRRTSRFWVIITALLGVYLLSTSLLNLLLRRGVKCEAEICELLETSPFVRGQPKLVVLLSYQRSGSTFVGEWFNINPDVFYNFEPVDSLYTAMYGTSQNLNVPSDITNYPNGSIRILPDEELNAVSKFLHRFLHCDLDSLPIQALMNFYFFLSYRQFKAAANYTDCIRSTFLTTFRECEPYLTSYCGSRFGEAPEAIQKDCFRRLWLNQVDHSASSVNTNISSNFTMHMSCLEDQRVLLRTTCQHLLLDVCRSHPIRVIKTVRATMDSMAPLLKTLPNFRVIHLVRDPRAVALSRKLFKGYVRGIYSGNDIDTIVKEATLYCRTAVRDIKARLRLEKEYPGKIYALLHDKLNTNTTLYLEQVHKFLDTTPPDSVIKWLTTNGTRNSHTNKTSEEIAKQWQYVITVKVNEEIVESCREFYELIQYRWDF